MGRGRGKKKEKEREVENLKNKIIVTNSVMGLDFQYLREKTRGTPFFKKKKFIVMPQKY